MFFSDDNFKGKLYVWGKNCKSPSAQIIGDWIPMIVIAGKPNWRGRLSTIDLLVLTILDQQLFVMIIFFYFFLQNKLP
jgi:hypothetical protein